MGFDLKKDFTNIITSINTTVESILATLTNVITSNFVKQIDYWHHYTHLGKVFTVSKTKRAVVQNGVFGILITASSDKSTHFTINYTAEFKAYFQTYKGGTYSGGTLFTPFNRSFNSANVYTGTILLDPTVDVTGIIRADDFVGTGGAASLRAGGIGGGGLESVLQPNEKLYIRFENANNGVADLNVIVNMYED